MRGRLSGHHVVAATPPRTVAIARTNAERTARVGRNTRLSSSRSPAIVSTRNASHQNTTRKIGAPPSHCTLPAVQASAPIVIVAMKSDACRRHTTTKIATRRDCRP
jgi:hypothetical protein